MLAFVGALRWMRAVALTTVICFAVTGCMSVRPVHLPSPDKPDYVLRIKPGRKVVATLQDGTVKSFELVSMDQETLVGKDVRVPIADIKELKVERLNQGRTWTAATVGGVILGFAALILAVSQSSTGT